MIPKGVTNLQDLFDIKERFKDPKNAKTRSSCPLHETVNIGTLENPRNVNLSKNISKEERKSYLKLFRQYQDVFAWSYKELKTYDTRIIQHAIPLKLGINPFQQKLKKYHPSLEPLMYQELRKLLDAKIIFQVRHSAWVANLVPENNGRNTIVCRLSEPQYSFGEGKLSHPTNGKTLADRVGLEYFLFA
jgi:hypothetical protein